MVTYGQEDYIEEAINGVLQQVCDYELELIIGNDNSPDNTNQIIQNILKTHPNSGCIKYINREKNLGMINNFIDVLKRCSGDYIAICDGDDIWTERNKIQKQVNFLELNPDFALSFHDAIVINDHDIYKEIKKYSDYTWNFIDHNREVYDITDLLYATLCPTSSVVFKKPANFKIPSWFAALPFGDMALFIIVTGQKKIKFFDETLSVYRRHLASTSVRPQQAQIFTHGKICMYFHLYDVVPAKYKVQIRSALENNVQELPNLMKLTILERRKLLKIIPIYYLKRVTGHYYIKLQSSLSKLKLRFK